MEVGGAYMPGLTEAVPLTNSVSTSALALGSASLGVLRASLGDPRYHATAWLSLHGYRPVEPSRSFETVLGGDAAVR